MNEEKYYNLSKEFFNNIDLKIDYAYLFGSVLKRLLPDSDIDILIQGDITVDQQLEMMGHLEQIFKRKTDIVLVDKASCDIVLRAMSTGKIILMNNKEKFKQDYFKNFWQYDDNTNLRRIIENKIKEKYSNGG